MCVCVCASEDTRGRTGCMNSHFQAREGMNAEQKILVRSE